MEILTADYVEKVYEEESVLREYSDALSCLKAEAMYKWCHQPVVNDARYSSESTASELTCKFTAAHPLKIAIKKHLKSQGYAASQRAP